MQKQRGRRRATSRKRDRGTRNGWSVSLRPVDARVGPDVVVPSMLEVMEAIEQIPAADDWPAIRPLVVPLLQRLRPFEPAEAQPLIVMVPPGIPISLAAHVGPLFIPVSAQQLTLFGISEAELVSQSIQNVTRLSKSVAPSALLESDMAGIELAALQTGHGIASTLVLVPDELARLFGPAPRLLIAPMRDLLIGLPADVDREFAAWLFAEFASQDPNGLAPAAYAFDGWRVTPVRLEPAGVMPPPSRATTARPRSRLA